MKNETLRQNILDYLLQNGAVSAGISTRETLRDSPPSADITYLMENGLSAITFAVPLNKKGVRPYLAKEDRFAFSKFGNPKGKSAAQLCHDVAEMIKGEGHQALATEANFRYRTEIEDWESFAPPDISHRYLAVASGVGSFGWSGNVGVKGYGTMVDLETVITDSELEPTMPIPEEENFCTKCKACARACPIEMFSETEEASVTIGGREYTHSARIEIRRCMLSCGGQTGLHKSKKWSSWSPGRHEIPEDSEGLLSTIGRAMERRNEWPPLEGEFILIGKGSKPESKTGYETRAFPSCKFCSLVCAGDKKETFDNLKVLHNSGCVIHYPDGSLKVLPPDEAEAEFNRMPSEHRALYC